MNREPLPCGQAPSPTRNSVASVVKKYARRGRVGSTVCSSPSRRRAPGATWKVKSMIQRRHGVEVPPSRLRKSRKPCAGSRAPEAVRRKPCDDMPTPMSVWSMGLTSSGHPWAGPGSPTASLRHRRLRMAGSKPQCPATHRRPQYPTGAAGRGWPAGAAGRGPPPKEPPAAGPEWARGAEWSPRTELDIGADTRTST